MSDDNLVELKPGLIVRFCYDGEKVDGTVRSVGPKRVHIQSGDRGVYVSPDDVIGVVRVPAENELPLLGERFRLLGGVK
ncbi:hypothetical protein DU504_11765 [Haloplanus salinus]|uniref:Uncharacterized protein n=1 Tax=Haloplanus salinus TaxID=1126245 RepID=A0A368NEZ7_9EURY|nr:hypothetical protein [Haloplanus salinus]RCU47909.1 hypothetical protein DU504_11765 [Haloplanus salinus]